MVTVGHYAGMKELRSEAYTDGFWCRRIIQTGPSTQIAVRHDYVLHLNKTAILLTPRLSRNVARHNLCISLQTHKIERLRPKFNPLPRNGRLPNFFNVS